MNSVKKIVERKAREGRNSYAELWDGKNENGVLVANGVYFYKLELSTGDSLLGKIVSGDR